MPLPSVAAIAGRAQTSSAWMLGPDGAPQAATSAIISSDATVSRMNRFGSQHSPSP